MSIREYFVGSKFVYYIYTEYIRKTFLGYWSSGGGGLPEKYLAEIDLLKTVLFYSFYGTAYLFNVKFEIATHV